MKRSIERNLLFVGSTWNLITSLLTIFSYNTQFNKEGARLLEKANTGTQIIGTNLMGNISKVILGFGLFILLGSIINFFIAIKIKDNMIQYNFMIWILIWAFIQLVTMDIIGFIIFMIAFIIYLAKNKAIKLSRNERKVL